MREKIKAGGHQSPYRLRKQLPEPVFGQIKQARGFRQFLLRGVEKVGRHLHRPQHLEAGPGTDFVHRRSRLRIGSNSDHSFRQISPNNQSGGGGGCFGLAPNARAVSRCGRLALDRAN
jgi:hypothetical protein